VVSGLSVAAWSEVLSGSTLASLRGVRNVFQEAVTWLELEEAQRLEEEALKTRLEDLLKQKQRLEQQTLELDANNKRARLGNDEYDNDTRPEKRARPEDNSKLDFLNSPVVPQTSSMPKPKYCLLAATSSRTEPAE